MSHSLFHALGRASGAARLLIGTALVAFLAACGGNATTTGAVGDDSDGSVLIVSTFAGKAGESGHADGQGENARFRDPVGITVDNFGNVYIADVNNNVVRKITPAGLVSTLAGTVGEPGDATGPVGSGKFTSLNALAVDVFSNVYVPDAEAADIKRIDSSGNISVYAGVKKDRTSILDGSRLDATFVYPLGVVVAQNSNVDILELTIGFSAFGGLTAANLVRSISAAGTVSTAMQQWINPGFAATGMALDGMGNRYFYYRGGKIEKNPANTNQRSLLFAGYDRSLNNVEVANFSFDKNLNTFIPKRHSIQKVSATGNAEYFAGSETEVGHKDGLLSEARFNFNASIGFAIAPDGTMYVAESANSVIRKISKGFYVGGVVRGLTGSEKVNVQNNGGATQSLSNGSFTFSMPVAQSATYNAQILSAEGHSCVMSNATGQVTTTVSSIVVDCTPIVQPPQYSAGGVVSGLLSGETVILKNGTDKTVELGNGTYTFLVKAASGTTYNVVVDTHPIGRTCDVTNGNGTINNANVTIVNVNCRTSTHSVSGFASGLGGGAVQLQINSSPTQTISSNGRFTLTSAISYSSTFDVNIISQPVGQTCEFGGVAAIAASSARVTGTVAGDVNVNLTCRTITYTVTAVVTGTSAGETVSLQMTGNPSGTQTLLLTGSASGAFTNRVPHGTSVGLAVLSSPAGKTCSLTSPASITVTGVSNVTVNCVVNAPIFYTVGGTVSGLPAFTTIDLLMASSDFASNQIATSISNGGYQFLTTVPSGSTISIAPTSPLGYSCTVASPYATGALVSGNVTNANVTCVSTGGGGGGGQAPGTISGNATNNTTNQITVLVRNTIVGLGQQEVSVTLSPNGGIGSFLIPGQVPAGNSYAVTAVEAFNDPNVTCAVTNGTGNMSSSPGFVNNVSISCSVVP